MDLATLIPQVAAHLGLNPSTLVFYIVVLNVIARAIARRIPNDATGFWGFVRQSAAVLGVEVSSRISSGVTVKDAAKAALHTPPLAEAVQAEADRQP